jgi:hypothetical protein
MSDRIGDWSQTFTGRQFWPLDPRAGDFDIRDVAHSLALQCRFAGHCRVFYSVGEHCVRVSWLVEDALAGLGHDSPETYAADVVRPLKRQLLGYAAIEHGIARPMETWFGLAPGAFDDPAVKRADEVLLMTEARDLMAPPPAAWTFAQGAPATPLPRRIRPWGWRHAEVRYLARYHELRGVRGWWRAALRGRPALALGFIAWALHVLVWGRRG